MISELERGMHFDEGKLPLDLYPIEAMVGITKVLQLGTKKYARRNWELGIDFSKIYASTMRHLTSWFMGEDVDPESGFNHLHHAACDIAFLQTYVERGLSPELDDRPIHKLLVEDPHV